jgi:transposase
VAHAGNRRGFEDRVKSPFSTTLSEVEEAMVGTFRQNTVLPLDDKADRPTTSAESCALQHPHHPDGQSHSVR